MAINNSHRGFALLISVIFMSVMLAFSLALSSLGYKQVVLASSALESQYAFYAADATLECALYADQQTTPNPFLSGYSDTSMICDNQSVGILSVGTDPIISQARIYLDNATHCADITVYKYSTPPQGSTYTTFIFSQGYNVSCSDVQNNVPRYAARGLQAHY